MSNQGFGNSIGIKLIHVQGGPLYMGSPHHELTRRDNEGPVHTVNLDSFYMSETQITQSQYYTVCKMNPSFFSCYGAGANLISGIDTSNFPVDSVSWEDAVMFCEKLSNLPEEKVVGRKYRLPKEKEWEYACRAGTYTPFNTGSTFSSLDANIDALYPYGCSIIGPSHHRTVPVGQYKPNSYGFYDMHGNVWEWCEDLYYLYSDFTPASNTARILRGGAWNCYSRFCRSAYRCICEPNVRYYDHGFRIVCEASKRSD